MSAERRKTETGFISELDERIFGKNTLSTRLFKYFLAMALFMLILPIVLSALFATFHIEQIFYYLSLPSLVTILLLFFVIYSIREILQPIKSLLHEVRRLQEGELDVKLDTGGYVEIESLAKSVDRMRNSLFIAKSFLGERDRAEDSILREEISTASLYLLFLAPFLLYGVSLTMIGGVLYSEETMNIMQSVLPMWDWIRAILLFIYGILMAFSFGYLLSKMIGEPMRKLAKAAEEASRGNMDVDFSVNRTLGYIHELSIRLNDLKEALVRAIKEMEGV